MATLSESLMKKTGPLAAPLSQWFDGAALTQLFRMNLRLIAQELSLPLKDILSSFLKGVKNGAFTLAWEYHCPHCNGIPDFKHRFDELSSGSFCPLCNVDFRNSLDKNVEVTFTLHPSLGEIPQPHQDQVKAEMLEAIKQQALLMPPVFLSGLDCMNNETFQELFGSEVLSSEESLEIGHVTLLFTDIKGSTEMYTRVGDVVSYRIVRDHFKVLFGKIQENGGLVVKTIGDAVMASFVKPENAVKAALEAYEAFQTLTWDSIGKLEIKMGIHEGGVIAVTMNNRMDFFGNTVNMAARIQGMAEDHSVCLTKEVMEQPSVRAYLKTWKQGRSEKIFRHKSQLKGIQGLTSYYRIRSELV